MKQIVALTASPAGTAHARLAAEALRAVATQAGHGFKVEVSDPAGPIGALTAADIAAADVILLAVDAAVDTARFSGKNVYETRTSAAIRHPQAILDAALARVSPVVAQAAPAASVAPVVARKRLVGITSCPTGIAHTFMAAEALKKAAAALGHDIRVETQGSVGAKNQLTPEEIAAADAVVIAADTNVDLARFGGKALARVSTKEAMHHGQKVITDALALPVPVAGSAGLAQSVEQLKAGRSSARSGAYKHLMTGVSHMLPIVIAGGLAIALAFAIGGIYAGNEKGTFAAALSQIGGGAAFQLMVAVLSGYIAFSIADRPGLAPGLVGGLLAQQLGAGFLGGIVSGFLAGYLTLFLARKIKLPDNLEGLKPVLILPFLSTLTVGLAMIFVIAPPVQAILSTMTEWLNSMRGANALLLGVILGSMMAFDMGGPVNKAAYTFGVGLLGSQVYTPMAAIMAAGMTPPLGIALAVWLAKNRFDADERKAGGAAAVLGLAFITEGAIPFAAKNPLRVIPALMLGSAVTGALSMVSGVQLLVPHGGVFALLIPGAVTHLVPYLLAIIAGTVVTTGALLLTLPKDSAPVAATA
ncbi:MAG: PTS fructose-like transporter subunit IIB [Opitutaceae bacterium]|jgi:PTS system fructose-specific IIC component